MARVIMPARKHAAIVGVGESDLGRVGERTPLQLQAQAAKLALADAGLSMGEVDGLFCAAGDWTTTPTLVLGEYLGLRPRHSDSTNIGGASFESHVGHAAVALEAGLCSVALISYAATPRANHHQRIARSGPIRYTEQFERVWGLPTPVGAYALAARRYMHEYQVPHESLAEVAVATRKWAAMNPRAYMRELITIDDVLASPTICDPLNLLDCCLVTDGGGAVVMTTAERAKSVAKPPVWVIGFGESHTHNTIVSMTDLVDLAAARESGGRAFDMAGIGRSELDVVEIYDSFTITVLLTLEALGFCPRGEAGDFVANQRTAPGGPFPMNTNGGGLSYCHPGMYGIFLLIEAVRQLRRESERRQVPGARLGLAHGTGVWLSAAATIILASD